MTGLRADSGSAAEWRALAERLAVSAAVGRHAPCLVDPGPFTSEAYEERDEAAAACLSCPGRVECARFAVAVDARDWVWGGVDLTTTGAPDRRALQRPERRRQLLEAAEPAAPQLPCAASTSLQVQHFRGPGDRRAGEQSSPALTLPCAVHGISTPDPTELHPIERNAR